MQVFKLKEQVKLKKYVYFGKKCQYKQPYQDNVNLKPWKPILLSGK